MNNTCTCTCSTFGPDPHDPDARHPRPRSCQHDEDSKVTEKEQAAYEQGIINGAQDERLRTAASERATRQMVIEVSPNAAEDPTFRFMDLFHRAKREGLRFGIFVFPEDAQNRTLASMRFIGDHPADLHCSLDIAEAYIGGYGWRDVPREE